jgi:hypothetical protein
MRAQRYYDARRAVRVPAAKDASGSARVPRRFAVAARAALYSIWLADID